MKRILAAGLVLVVLLFAATAQADLRSQARHLRAEVVHRYGKRAPGRDIVRYGVWDGSHSRRANRAQLRAYVGTLNGMLALSAVARAYTSTSSASTSSYTTSSSAPAPVSASGGLEACIIQRESGGNAQARNGQYSGIAQWSQTSWENGGGTRYAPTPTQASASEQEAVLGSMLAHGQSGQWTPYDGC